ncbi:unnamed protein product [marine sediment metagenome]|uniref:Homing endonuclease LAGLIDADG domain-containing protein n=1 Tax=marine sediment metagenome TaxID=412755 RepID=X1QMT1_9ZZZZ
MDGRAVTLELLGTNELEIAYIAGLFDGEGCVAVDRRYLPHNPGLTIEAKIGITTPAPLYLCQRIFGGKVQVETRHKGWHDCYRWRIFAKRAEVFFRVVEPYLIIKKDQANLAITLSSLRHSKSPLRWKIAEKIASLKLVNQPVNPDEQNGNQR